MKQFRYVACSVLLSMTFVAQAIAQKDTLHVETHAAPQRPLAPSPAVLKPEGLTAPVGVIAPQSQTLVIPTPTAPVGVVAPHSSSHRGLVMPPARENEKNSKGIVMPPTSETKE